MSASLCTPATFAPVLSGAAILNLSTNLVTGVNSTVSSTFNYNHPTIKVTNATYCNVTVTYTHSGANDTINVETWLPMNDTYNGRLQATGGGGWVAGRFFLSYQTMTAAIGQGYAAVTTDAGLGSATEPTSWGLESPGNPNLNLLQDLASVSLADEAVIAKSLIQSFYGTGPAHSYWSGCSQGGRQGLMLAQRYPDIYDGIVASSPAINWAQFIPALYYSQLMMNLMGQYPKGCELDAIGNAAIAACDGLDGVVDGLISDMDACSFDAFSTVGTVVQNCSQTGTDIPISATAATVANLTWTGARSANGSFLWYGKSFGADLSGSATGQGDAATVCSQNGTCVGNDADANPLLAIDWAKFFIQADANFNMDNITHEQFDSIFQSSVQRYNDIIGTADANLTAFKAAGGKMLTYHGLNDQVIAPKGTEDYYNAVTAAVPDVQSFYRFYQVPGLQHCSGGNGGQPTAIFDAMVAWVENGTVPETLPISFTGNNGTAVNRKLCSYPLKPKYDGMGDSNSADSFVCS
ncbi:carboxylic ester hydrolase-13 [Coleophoma cylindrospora]|uniref:Carboxylic ester hydrolase n=1 Tax=Coleophoma cylindrospora TaxID=1849047 RepID=A0A3D8Q229_9HELO|nr:carboxylic ester hydrolase-13 [Coleophoma cylindrospora]